eukprot:scaffold1573_cov125-Isochrysis_galbana.AAC.2
MPLAQKAVLADYVVVSPRRYEALQPVARVGQPGQPGCPAGAQNTHVHTWQKMFSWLPPKERTGR